MINTAILGYGTVGSGIAEVLTMNSELIEKRAGDRLEIKHILDLRDFPGDPFESIITHDFEDILNDDSIKIVAEVMGGVEPAYTFTKKLLQKGVSVVTSNKELVAAHGPELIAIAASTNANYNFEASVGGGIPIIRPINTSFTADEILEISGILNGTTNFILTKMTAEGTSFDVALKEAQDLGYAERNPEADIKGFDPCRKIAILASLVLGKTVDYNDIYTEGIDKITPVDLEYVKKLNCALKLVASLKLLDEGVFVKVTPLMIPMAHPLSMVNDSYNAVFVKGNAVENTMFYGRGAGKLPTASACVADMVDSARNLGKNVKIDWSSEKVQLMPLDNTPVNALIRVKYNSEKDARNACSEVFSGCKFATLNHCFDEFAVLVENETEGSLSEKCAALKEKSAVSDIANIIRFEN
ncbi:MAG: homoserine dehydrogenase [Firmicutes bacterium]|nr:homoserine dehydrogenase [Bacillota bacterium]